MERHEPLKGPARWTARQIPASRARQPWQKRVIPMLQRQVRAAEYRRLSIQASALAESSTLEKVREKHELAAATWAALAALDEDS
jgi:cell division protein FtsL